MIKNMQQLKYLIRESLNIHKKKFSILREGLEDDGSDFGYEDDDDIFNSNQNDYQIDDIYDDFLKDKQISEDEAILIDKYNELFLNLCDRNDTDYQKFYENTNIDFENEKIFLKNDKQSIEKIIKAWQAFIKKDQKDDEAKKMINLVTKLAQAFKKFKPKAFVLKYLFIKINDNSFAKIIQKADKNKINDLANEIINKLNETKISDDEFSEIIKSSIDENENSRHPLLTSNNVAGLKQTMSFMLGKNSGNITNSFLNVMSEKLTLIDQYITANNINNKIDFMEKLKNPNSDEHKKFLESKWGKKFGDGMVVYTEAEEVALEKIEELIKQLQDDPSAAAQEAQKVEQQNIKPIVKKVEVINREASKETVSNDNYEDLNMN